MEQTCSNQLTDELLFCYGVFVDGALELQWTCSSNTEFGQFPVSAHSFFVCSGCVPSRSSTHRVPGKKATVPVYKVLARPGREANSPPTNTKADVLTSRPRAGLSNLLTDELVTVTGKKTINQLVRSTQLRATQTAASIEPNHKTRTLQVIRSSMQWNSQIDHLIFATPFHVRAIYHGERTDPHQ